MQNLMTKLTSYASLVGVIGAISGGAMWIGELTTRLEAVESKEFVVNETVDLSEVHQKIADLDKEVQGDLNILATKIEALKSEIAINKAGIDYLEAKTDELETKFGNPLQ